MVTLFTQTLSMNEKEILYISKNNSNAKVTFIFDDLGVCLTRLRESKMFLIVQFLKLNQFLKSSSCLSVIIKQYSTNQQSKNTIRIKLDVTKD